MARRRVVITGAAGYVGQRMFKELAERWDLVPIDVIAATRSGEKVPGLVVADLTRPDRNEYRQHFRGADAVIHLGYVRATGKVDGRKLEVVQWRIGGPRDDDIEHVKPGDIKVMHRALGAYLSRRDQVQQAIRMVETPDISVPFLIVY